MTLSNNRQILIPSASSADRSNFAFASIISNHLTNAVDKYIVKHAIDLKEKADKNIPYSHVWCVFDRDSFQAQQFNQAIQRAVSNGIQVAYSNEAFEFWYILHFEYLQAGLNREKYKNKLTGHLKKEYKKNDPGIYQQLLDKQPKAIKWAQMLIDEKGSKHNPEKDNPCTNVHRLVIFLNKYLNIPNNDRNQQT